MHAETSPLITAEDLLDVDIPGQWTELIRGRLVVREPPGTYHGIVASKLAYLLGRVVYENRLGVLTGQDTGFKIASNPDTVRAPDVGFVSHDRAGVIEPHGYAAIAPDLAVEIVSPSDTRGEVLTKVGDWLDAGVKLVWVIDPSRREAQLHRADGSLSVVKPDGTLDGEDVVAGFTCPLSHVFQP